MFALRDFVLDDVRLNNYQLHQLHKNLSGLKSLTLKYHYYSSIYDKDESNSHDFTRQLIVNHLKSFKLEVGIHPNELFSGILSEVLRITIIRRLNYIHQSYHKLTTSIIDVQSSSLQDFNLVQCVPLDFDHVQQLIGGIVHQMGNINLIQTELYRFTKMNIVAYKKHYFKTVELWDLCIDVAAQIKHLHSFTLINSIKAIHYGFSNANQYRQLSGTKFGICAPGLFAAILAQP
ncbi:hypothetical protein PS15m_000647 [Mucor circinelloides]